MFAFRWLPVALVAETSCSSGDGGNACDPAAWAATQGPYQTCFCRADPCICDCDSAACDDSAGDEDGCDASGC
jgi:hypothetical protein